MYQIAFLLFLFISITTQPIFAQKQTVQIKTNLTFFSEKFLGQENEFRSSSKSIAKLNLSHDFNNSSSQLSFSFNEDGNYNIDGSYLQHTSGIATFGIGSIDRLWSFSNNTSLILSQNGRPPKSIYLKLEDKFSYNLLSPEANWSFEVFNGFNDGAIKDTTSMILGVRAILTPIEGLDFEFVQTSQWGGPGHSTGLSAFSSALFFDTNDGSNQNINKMAGFGISYLIPSDTMPLRIYGQAIGEDEAGNLPSCYAYMAGLEWANLKFKYPIKFGFEILDTRIDETTHGYCGPNTMYNNSVYDYTNYGKTMGIAIDSEGTSQGIYITSQISQKINIELSTKSVVINDNNWLGHRLSSKRQSGLITSLDLSWVKNNISFSGNIYNQGFNLDKANIKSHVGVGFSSSIMF